MLVFNKVSYALLRRFDSYSRYQFQDGFHGVMVSTRHCECRSVGSNPTGSPRERIFVPVV